MEDEEIRRMLTEPMPVQFVPTPAALTSQQVDDLTRAIEALTAAVSMVAHLMENPPRKPYQR